jgi:hypothetical protein
MKPTVMRIHPDLEAGCIRFVIDGNLASASAANERGRQNIESQPAQEAEKPPGKRQRAYLSAGGFAGATGSTLAVSGFGLQAMAAASNSWPSLQLA